MKDHGIFLVYTESPNSGRMREVMTHATGSPGVYRRISPQ